jgi:hypothetical protein
LWICASLGLLLSSCGSSVPPSYFLSHHPDDTTSRQLRHYPVARQGDLTAWLTSDHVHPNSDWIYVPGDPNPKHRIVGNIPASAMPQAAKHDGAFLIVRGYDGPLFDLWQGTDAEVSLFTGSGGWIPALIHQDDSVNSWVKVSPRHNIGGWSGYPVVLGDPNHPEAIAGAMWYKSNLDPQLGGATSTRMLQRELAKLRFADFVKP